MLPVLPSELVVDWCFRRHPHQPSPFPTRAQSNQLMVDGKPGSMVRTMHRRLGRRPFRKEMCRASDPKAHSCSDPPCIVAGPSVVAANDVGGALPRHLRT